MEIVWLCALGVMGAYVHPMPLYWVAYAAYAAVVIGVKIWDKKHKNLKKK